MMPHEQNGHNGQMMAAPGTTSHNSDAEYLRLQQRVAWLEQENTALQHQVLRYMGELEHVDQSLQDLEADYQHLRQRQRLFESLIENSSEFVGMVSLDGQPLYLNTPGKELVGLASKATFEQTTILDYVFPEDLPHFQQHILPIMQEQGHWAGELRFRHFQTETPIPVYYSAFVVNDTETGQPIGLGTVTRDLTAFRQSEAEKQQSQERLELVLEATQDGFWDWSIPTGDVYYNDRWQTMLGYAPGELSSHVTTWEGLMHPHDRARTLTLIANHLHAEDTSFTVEFRLQTKTSGWKWILARGKVVERNAQGQPLRMVGTHTDIDERKQMEEDLRQSKDLLRVIIDTIPQGIFWKDHNLVYQGCNQTFARAAGLERPEDIVGKDDNALPWKPEESTFFRQVDMAVMTSDTAQYNIVEPQLQANGKQAWLNTNKIPLHDEAGNVIGILGSFDDITERRAMQEELRTFKTLVDNAPDGIGFSSLDGRLVYSNRALQTMLGYDDAMVGLAIADLHTEESQQFLPEITRRVSSGESWSGVLDQRQSDGTALPAHISVFPITNSNGTMISIGAILHDLTQQRQQEAEREGLQQQVIDAQGDAIRELSTPLLPLADGVLAMPLVGAIDTQRAQQVTETLLEGVSHYRTNTVIIDITGVKVVDTQVAQALMQTAQAVKLLGAQVILTGIQPQIAQTLVQLGVDLQGLVTRSTLQSGISYALQAQNGNRFARR
ncbi:MAG: PAS domain S-box protein [Chloroflexaceae bacterium]|nr:PAS domain S-box protein [Chloroflexaceae bacterium]